MSNPGGNSSGKMESPFFHEFKKQASFFLKEKMIKTARLVLTDVTPAQLLAEEVTNGNPGAPDARTLKIISRAAFEVDDYWRIVEILHKRFASFDRKNWRASYNALIVLEHLLTHGPESVAEEFQIEKDSIKQIGSFQHVDEKGFNWGLTIRKKSERILNLLDSKPLLKEERNRARTITKEIQGFGSFCSRTPSDQDVLQESSLKTYGKCNSQFNEHGNEESSISFSDDRYLTNEKQGKSQQSNGKDANLEANDEADILISGNFFASKQVLGNASSRISFKENMAPDREFLVENLDEGNSANESHPLLIEESSNNTRVNISADDDHPFDRTEHLTTASLLSTNRIL